MVLRASHSWLLSLLFCVACDAQSPKAGEEGGACQPGPSQCQNDLTCIAGTCRVGESVPTPTQLDIDFFLELSELPADGRSMFVFEVYVSENESEEPYNGDVYIYPDPVAAGDVSPRPLEIEDGFGLGTYTACERGKDVECPDYVRLIVTTLADPIRPIAASEHFRLQDDPNAVTRPDTSGVEQNDTSIGLSEGSDAAGRETSETPADGEQNAGGGTEVPAPEPGIGGVMDSSTNAAGDASLSDDFSPGGMGGSSD